MEQLKILAADDDPGALLFYKSLLTEAGYLVETAVEATAAIILFKESPSDLLILDVDMPSGGEAGIRYSPRYYPKRSSGRVCYGPARKGGL